MKLRLDQLLVQRGLCETRAKAQARILAGEVLVDDRPVTKAGTLVSEEAALRLRGKGLPYVSRGGLKLAAALDAFAIDPTGWICLDAGASTGGFTDCLLQRGASFVYAVDVGTNQLHHKLRVDPRVRSIEQANLRTFDLDRIPDPIRLMVADLSFISLTLALPPVLPLLEPSGAAVLLVKPQFEAGRGQVGEGGIVRDPAIHRQVLEGIWAFFAGTPFKPQAWMESPLRGGSGNLEFLMHLKGEGQERPFPESPTREALKG